MQGATEAVQMGCRARGGGTEGMQYGVDTSFGLLWHRNDSASYRWSCQLTPRVNERTTYDEFELELIL